MRLVKCFLVAILLVLTSCNKNDDDDQDIENLEFLLNEINVISDSVDCENVEDWRIIEFGYRECGFTSQIKAFHSSVDNEELELKIARYTEIQKEIVQSNKLKVACLSIAKQNYLLNVFEVINCVEGKTRIGVESEFDNTYLLGKWIMSSFQIGNSEEQATDEVVIEFSMTGYTINSTSCSSEGVYNFDESINEVIMSSSQCNEEGILFSCERDEFILEFTSECNNNTDGCFQRFIRLIE